MKVLVVDDVGYSRHYHSRLLQKFGYQTEAVESGPQALELLQNDPSFNVVLTDLMMRDMDGVELFKRSASVSRPADRGVPPAFILMTSLQPGKEGSQQKDLEKIRTAKDIGFVEVLFKPIEPESLKSVLDTIKYARSLATIDTGEVVRKVSETVQRLIAAQMIDDAGSFLDELRNEIEKLDQFVSQPV